MASYLGFFSEGLLEIEKEILNDQFNDLNIVSEGDDHLYFETEKLIEVNDLYFFKKFFKIIKYSTENYKLEDQLAWLRSNIKSLNLDVHKYRIVVSKYKINQKDYLLKISEIEEVMRKAGIKIDSGHPDLELKVFEKENYGFIGIDLPQEQVMIKDKIDLDVAYCMNNLSEINESDIFLDPFCGFGTIPVLRSLQPAEQIIASDIDISKIINQKSESEGIDIIQQDFFSSDYSDMNINKIVTDPPWNAYSQVDDVDTFYRKMFDKFSEIINSDGVVVLLTNQDEVMNEIISSTNFKVEKKFEVLVSGKEAIIYKFRKV